LTQAIQREPQKLSWRGPLNGPLSRHNPAATPGKNKHNNETRQKAKQPKPPQNKQNHKQQKVIRWPVQQRQSKG
jgi:hypothetical protein